MRKIGIYAGAIACLSTAGANMALSQSLAVRAGTVVFNRPEFDTLVLLEFPFALNRSEYTFFQPDSTLTAYAARIFAQVNIYDTLGGPVDSANTYFSTSVADSLEARRENYSLFHSLVLAVRPGVYSGRLTVIDVVSKREGEFKYGKINIAPPPRDRLVIGGASLAYQVRYDGADSETDHSVPRNGYRVLCNPDGLFSTKDTAVFVYAEAYNLDYRENLPGSFALSLAVLDDSGAVFRVLGTRTRVKSAPTAVIVESFDIGGWPEGAYVLEMKLVDSSVSQEVVRALPFGIIAPASVSALAAAIPDMQADVDLATQLNLARFLLTPDEKAALERLTDAGQLSFLRQYWQDRDPDPATSDNEYFRKILERYLYANNFFSTEEGQADGWKTDRGRVLIVYGPWDRLEDQIHPKGDYPYQVWWYDQSRHDAVFVFVDDRGFGTFRLVHSTMPGEIYDEDWDQAIRAGFLELE